ncbi:glycosyltransferase [Marinobacter mangrovi]|uniref:glycosyltransferase n=1 Tax=Marinobacter mangrovi TaxID=2803918 RepID=UPI0019349D94|nr:glycosyltransferase [Marinobacter mangrovi]
MAGNNRCIWLAWEGHTRSRSLASELEIPLHEIIIKGNKIKRYIISLYKTATVVKRYSPEIIFFQNPSIVLSVFLVLLRPFHKARLIMDTHNAGVYPLEGRNRILSWISYWLSRKVDLSIVTNEYLAKEVKRRRGSSYVLTDPIPKFPKYSRSSNELPEEVYVVLVCTWADDEPYMEVISAAKILEEYDVNIHITGKPPKHVLEMSKPKNVVLEGFVSHEEYLALISDATLLIDLTSRENCLVCGAYEAAAVGTPCIISETDISKKVFKDGYLYTSNSAADIARKIVIGLERNSELRKQLVSFKLEYSKNFSNKIKDLALLTGV